MSSTDRLHNLNKLTASATQIVCVNGTNRLHRQHKSCSSPARIIFIGCAQWACFSDTGRLSGTLGYNSRVNKDSYEVLFTVYNTSEWSKSLYRLDVRFQVIGNVEVI